ncbi:hypothetical protein F5882DRAFT_457358 [Hyaloscypha sp. PMI_1271]|nr:hypothetical protein F5882DRAFT_457358 [Hyaloscypha sp. PMI_1271]
MAVLDALEGIEVSICVDGQALHEYNDDDIEAQAEAVGAHQASKTVSKYIEAATGKEFAIKLTVKSPYKMDCPTLSFSCRVDGMKVEKRILRETNYKSASGFESVVNGLRHVLGGVSERSSIKHFQFAEIKTTENNSKLSTVKDDAIRINGVGEISVWVFRKSKGFRTGMINNLSFESNLEGEIHEKALKGQSKSHRTSLGTAQPAQPLKTWITEFLDGEDYPVGIFRFKYRSREALKSLLIIERSPEPEQEQAGANTPGPTPTVNNDGLDADMRRKVEEFKKSLLEAKGASKLKAEDSNQTQTARVKRENTDEGQGRKVNKKPKYKTTIDLTEDDDEENNNSTALDD